MSSYFTLPSFARAKKNKEALEKTNPTEPVLKDEDEKFLTKITSQDAQAPEGVKDVAPTKITDDGKEVEVPKEEAQVEGATNADQVAVPETKPEAATAGDEEKKASSDENKAEEDAPADSKTEESKTEESKAEDSKAEDSKAEDSKAEDSKAEDSKAEDSKAEESAGAEKASTSTAKPDESKMDEDTAPSDSKQEATETAEDPPEQEIEENSEKPKLERKKSKRSKGFELPSQEEAEAATKGFNSQEAQQAQGGDSKASGGEKRTWASYLPNIRKGAKSESTASEKKDDTAEKKDDSEDDKKDDSTTEKDAATTKDEAASDEPMSRSWVQYASAYVPSASSLPSLPSLPASWSRGKDASSEPVLNEDGSVNEEATKEKQEREVSVLLDNLSLSSINNRVFSFSADSQKYYDRFTQVLKDVMTGAPTAYEDMDKLMKDAGPVLEKQFESMPPFVQTLVKSLPAKLGTTLGPELMAAASEKPGNDMKARMAATSNKSKSGDSSIEPATEEQNKKKKRKIPGLKSLVGEQGMVASILRNIVSFLKVRFPFVIGTTNVVMSLAVFILMFVFWYCHKRGKEVRLQKEHDAEAPTNGAAEREEGEDSDIEVSDSDEEEDSSADALAERIADGVRNDTTAAAEDSEEKGEKEKEDVLNKPEPPQVPLPDTEKGEQGAALEEAKSVGV